MESDDNPFDELELDPRMGPRELTEALRRRAERALPSERKRLQEQWRRLTLRERDRVRWGLLAHPRSSTTSGAVDELRRRVPPFVGRVDVPSIDPRASDALVLPESAHSEAPEIHPRSVLDELDVEALREEEDERR
jgi:hypothetical protein